MDNWWRGSSEYKKLKDVLKNVGSSIIVFDVETTGLDPNADRIVQISAIKLKIGSDNEFNKVGVFDEYIKPPFLVNDEITKLTGISNDFLANKAVETDAFNRIREFFGDSGILCGHNAQDFDINFINKLYERNAGFTPDFTVLDTCVMARELLRKAEFGNNPTKGKVANYKLGTLADYFGVTDDVQFHNSMGDVTATVRLLSCFINLYNEDERFNINNGSIRPNILAVWAYDGYKGMRRLYVKLDYEDRIIWVNRNYPFDWGEKTKGTIQLVDMDYIERTFMDIQNIQKIHQISKLKVINKY